MRLPWPFRRSDSGAGAPAPVADGATQRLAAPVRRDWRAAGVGTRRGAGVTDPAAWVYRIKGAGRAPGPRRGRVATGVSDSHGASWCARGAAPACARPWRVGARDSSIPRGGSARSTDLHWSPHVATGPAAHARMPPFTDDHGRRGRPRCGDSRGGSSGTPHGGRSASAVAAPGVRPSAPISAPWPA